MQLEQLDTEQAHAIVALRRRGLSNQAVAAARHTHGSFAAAARALVSPADLAFTRRRVRQLLDRGVRMVCLGDPAYPEALGHTHDAPLVLFVDGSLAGTDDPAVAIVGSRRASPEGKRIAEVLARSLGERGITVVSGLARGIDGAAHRGALAGGGRTLAVLGNGIDVVYPREHLELYGAVRGSGALLSELAPGAEPAPWHFPMRNRILAGLARVVVVVEAAERSGSRITARVANDEGRSVLAVPGSPLDPAHRGTNQMIKKGEATLMESLDDLLHELPAHLFREHPAAPGLTPGRHATEEESRVLHVLSSDPLHLDGVATRAGLGTEQVASLLLALELRGAVARLPGARYVRLADARGFAGAPGASGDSLDPTVLSSEVP